VDALALRKESNNRPWFLSRRLRCL
jgi:hypothetical protein